MNWVEIGQNRTTEVVPVLPVHSFCSGPGCHRSIPYLIHLMMHTMRQYQAEDIDALVSVWQKANAVPQPFLKDAFVSQVARDMRNIYLSNRETWGFEVDESPVGFMLCWKTR